MNLTHIETDPGASPIVTRLARVLAECLDPDAEYDCKVAIFTTTNDAIDEHGASDIPTGGYEYRYAELGVELLIHFDDNADCPSIKSSTIVDEFSEALDREHGINFLSSFDGADGRFRALAFPVLDAEFTCSVHDPSWA